MVQSSRGVTLIEMMITVFIVAVGVALALPTWDSIMQRREVTRGAEDIAALLAIAQSEAVKRNEIIEVFAERDGDKDWCIRVYTEEDADECACDGDPPEAGYTGYCGWIAGELTRESDGAMESVYQKMSMEQLLAGGTGVNSFDFWFEPMHGLKAEVDEPDTTEFDLHAVLLQSNSEDFSLRVDINATGRVSICTPDGSVPGYGDCPG